MSRSIDSAVPVLPRGIGPTTFVWSTEPDCHAPKGVRYVLRSTHYPKHSLSPLCADDRVGTCGWSRSFERGKRGQWEASFYVGYDSIRVTAATARTAIAALQREVDRRSIGLFGLDEIAFSDAA